MNVALFDSIPNSYTNQFNDLLVVGVFVIAVRNSCDAYY
jgi:hypothetical protein